MEGSAMSIDWGNDSETTEKGSDLKKWILKRKKKIFKKKTLYKRIPCLQWIPRYTLQDFFSDLIAGITVGVTVIPQGLAYSTVAGLPPEYGLYAGFMGCFLYVIFGSTQAVTIGPTALMALVTHDVTLRLGPSGAILLALLTGCIVLVLGILNLGFLVEFMSPAVVGGFSSAAAVTIATTQFSSLLGISAKADGFLQQWIEIFSRIGETSLWDSVMGFGSIAVLLLLKYLDRVRFGGKGNRSTAHKVVNKLLWGLSVSRNAVVLLICSLIAASIFNSLENPQDMPFKLTGNITSGLPLFKPPDFSFEFGNSSYTFGEACREMGSSIIVAPLIGILETVAIAKSFAKGRKFDASQEMIAIGISNVLGSFVSSFPVTGSFSRTAVNAASGVKTPLNGIYTGSLVILAASVLTPYFYFIPKSCLAAVIISAVIFMIEFHLVPAIWKTRKIDLLSLLITFVSCLFLSLEYGILIGAAVSLAIVLYSTARPRITSTLQREHLTDYLVVEIDRALPFTAMDYYVAKVRKKVLQQQLQQQQVHQLVIVLDLTNVVTADSATAFGMKQLVKELESKGHKVVLKGVHKQILQILKGSLKDLVVWDNKEDIKIPLDSIENVDVDFN